MYLHIHLTYTQVLEEKQRPYKSPKPKSKSSSPSQKKEYIRIQSSVDSTDSDIAPKNCNVDGSDSDSDCYVGPLEMKHAISMSYSEGMKHHNYCNSGSDDNCSLEYDYPYIEEIKNSPTGSKPTSKHGYQNVPNKTVKHSKVKIQKSLSFDSSVSPDNCSDGMEYEVLSNLKPSNTQVMRPSSQVDILEPVGEDEDYIRMNNNKYVNAMVKSHSYDDTRVLQSMSESVVVRPKPPPAESSKVEHDYKQLDQLTISDDGKLHDNK